MSPREALVVAWLTFSHPRQVVSCRILGAPLSAARVCWICSFSPQLRLKKYDLDDVASWIILVSWMKCLDAKRRIAT